MNVAAYPLQWPDGWKRTINYDRKRGNFSSHGKEISIAVAAQRLVDELVRMDIQRADIVLSTNAQLRLDGMPRSDQRAMSDPGAAVYWRDGATTRCMAVDRYTDVAQNIAALAATIEAMRAIERHGGAIVLERAFQGFAALPSSITKDWRTVLGIIAKNPSRETIEASYRRERSNAHPDKGGSTERFHAVQEAYEAALREVPQSA